MAIFNAPTKKYAGYIFDLDGTLAHSMPVHYKAWVRATEPFGVAMTEDLFYSLGGVPTRRIVEILNERFRCSMDPELVADQKESFFLEMMTTMQPIEEVAEFARQVATYAEVAVASGGTLPIVERTLRAVGFKDFFPVIVTSEQVERGKPFPDMFLEAARRMRVEPTACLVIEDSPAGIKAAEAAGMDHVLVGRP
ncbi:MAG: HAD family phosphatase [Verrucomicrobia bacterium]|nr:HAD family phosphatase [Verrucomicrobiota bacterium]